MLHYEFGMVEIKTLWILHVEIWGEHFASEFSVFFVKAEWITEMLFMPLVAE